MNTSEKLLFFSWAQTHGSVFVTKGPARNIVESRCPWFIRIVIERRIYGLCVEVPQFIFVFLSMYHLFYYAPFSFFTAVVGLDTISRRSLLNQFSLEEQWRKPIRALDHSSFLSIAFDICFCYTLDTFVGFGFFFCFTTGISFNKNVFGESLICITLSECSESR